MSVGDKINAILKTLPAGFRFCPTDEELVDQHLKPKILGMDSQVDIIPEVDVCKWEPWELPGFSVIKTDDPEWFFFSPLHKKYQNGSQFKRATKAGYWKPTGPGRDILSGTNEEVIGTRKTLVFYGRCGRGRAALKTNWIIHQYQYRADNASLPSDRAYVLCRLKKEKNKKTGSDIPTPDEAVAGGFSPEINFNGVLSELPIVQETWLMDMELENSSTGTGIHQNGQANNMTLGAGLSHNASNIASDIGNYQVEEMTSDEDPQLPGLLNDITFTPPDSDWFSDTEQGLDMDLPFPSGFNNSCGSRHFQDGVDTEFADSLIVDPDEYYCEGLSCQRSSAVYSGNLNHGSVDRLSARPQTPLKGVYGKGGGSSSNTNTQVFQRVDPKGVELAGNVSNNDILQDKSTKLSFSMSKLEEKSVSIKAKDRAEYGSATDLPQNSNPIREPNKNCQVTEKANPNLSSLWNEPVGKNQKGSFSSPETASASHEPSSSPGYLVNLLVGILLFVVLIAVMVLDINAMV